MKPQGPDKIFTSTPCLNKEQLLQYTKNELSATDKHRAEMHMIDCDLCSDALEGFILLPGNKTIEDTLSEVRKLTLPAIKSKKPEAYRIWLAAASLIFITGITFYIYNQVKQSATAILSEQKNIKKESPAEGLPVPSEKKESKPESIPSETSASKLSETKVEKPARSNAPLNFSLKDDNKKQGYSDKSMPVVTNIQIEKIASIAPAEEADHIETVDESAASIAVVKEADGRRPAAQNKSANQSRGNNLQFIDGYKTVAYHDDNSSMDSLLITDQQGLEAIYENKQIKKEGNDKSNNDLHHAGYNAFLQQGIHHFKNEEYKKALVIFDQINKARKNDENALFYGGLSLAALNQNKQALQHLDPLLKNKFSTFYEEARWNTALIYLKEKNTASARLLLKEINDDKGFYSIQAGEKLRELK